MAMIGEPVEIVEVELSPEEAPSEDAPEVVETPAEAEPVPA